MSVDLGALPQGSDVVHFRVWAPRARTVDVHVIAPGPSRLVPLSPQESGEFAASVAGVAAGARYFYRLDGGPGRPDPVSRSQPEGVHGPSAVVDPAAFPWTDAGWPGVVLADLRLYELHVGLFSPEGTFDGVVPHLPRLRDLGVTAIELMPVAEFPGARNWGYDGVHLFAPQSTYGGPDGLRRLVDAAHRLGLGVVLDVVYNHLGPEGNYLPAYGPYLSDRHGTPWGPAINYDGADAWAVRRHVVGSARAWIREYHLDGLRLDAVHAITDRSPVHILAELAEAVEAEGRALGRMVHAIPEMNRNERRIVLPRSRGGYGFPAQWSDDFHHALRVTLTGVRGGYYDDFQRGLDDLEVALRDAWVYQGQHSTFRGHGLGSPAADLPGTAFVVFAQNHDQVGNQVRGDRLARQASPAAVKVAAATVLLAPYLPLLFMGEEYGETAPFCFFTSFTDPGPAQAVRAGRRAEFARFAWTGEVPDPQDPATYAACRLDHTRRQRSPHRELEAWYAALLTLRRLQPALRAPDRGGTRVSRAGPALVVHRWVPEEAASGGPSGGAVLALLSYASLPAEVDVTVPGGSWELVLDSENTAYAGAGGAGGRGAPERLAGGPQVVALAPYQTLVFLTLPARP